MGFMAFILSYLYAWVASLSSHLSTYCLPPLIFIGGGLLIFWEEGAAATSNFTASLPLS